MTILQRAEPFAEALSKADFDVISIDWVIDPSKARELTAIVLHYKAISIQDVVSSEKIMKANVKKMCAGFGKQRYIANLDGVCNHI